MNETSDIYKNKLNYISPRVNDRNEKTEIKDSNELIHSVNSQRYKKYKINYVDNLIKKKSKHALKHAIEKTNDIITHHESPVHEVHRFSKKIFTEKANVVKNTKDNSKVQCHVVANAEINLPKVEVLQNFDNVNIKNIKNKKSNKKLIKKLEL